MRFEKVKSIKFPREQVREVMIQHLDKITDHRSRLKDMICRRREQFEDGRVKIEWHMRAMINTVPVMFRPFMSKGLLSWSEEVLWHPEDFLGAWTLSSALSRLYKCEGEHRLENSQGRTKLYIRGEVTIYPDKVPGVPTFMARRLVPRAEKIIIGLIDPDLEEVATGIQRFLEDRG